MLATWKKRTMALGLAGGMLMAPFAAGEESAARVQSLVREHAAGMKFAKIESKSGKTFRDVVVDER